MCYDTVLFFSAQYKRELAAAAAGMTFVHHSELQAQYHSSSDDQSESDSETKPEECALARDVAVVSLNEQASPESATPRATASVNTAVEVEHEQIPSQVCIFV